MIPLDDYLNRLENALANNMVYWFPMDKTERREVNIRFAHEFGYGIAEYDNWQEIIKVTYGKLIVRHSLDSVGVAIDNKEWIREINVGANQNVACKK